MTLLPDDVEKLLAAAEALHQEKTACNPLIYLRNKVTRNLKILKLKRNKINRHISGCFDWWIVLLS